MSEEYLLSCSRELQSPNVFGITKYGRTTNADSGVPRDIWDKTDQHIWLAPTAARPHQVKSDDVGDTVVGAGARTIKIQGLETWASLESEELIAMDGTTNVTTVKSYVIIHRAKVVTKGGSSSNIGTITITADIDATISAQINPGKGQTQMAILGVGNLQDMHLGRLFASINKTPSTAKSADIELCFNPEPDVQITNFLTKFPFGLSTAGNSSQNIPFWMPLRMKGPGILKMQVETDTDNMDVTGSFDLAIIKK